MPEELNAASPWVESARKLAPALAQRAARAETTRRVPDETVEDFRSAGFFRLLVPHAYGGDEARFADVASVSIELARGCTSSAWVLSLFAMHSWLTSLFSKAAQEEVFSPQGESLVASPAGSGRAEIGDGVYRLSGRWNWATGVHHCDWLILNAVVGMGHEPEGRCFLVPAKDVEVIECWQASGMCATGSDDVIVRNAVVPAYRTLAASAVLSGDTPGAALHDTPLYRVPAVAAHALVAAAPALGAAIETAHQYKALLRCREAQSLGEELESSAPLMRFARAHVRIDAARLLHRHALDTLETLDFGAPDEPDLRGWIRMVAAHVVTECRGVVREVLDASGARAHLVDSPLQRLARDVTVLSGHTLFDMDSASDLYGRLAAGHQPRTPLL